MNPEGKSAAVFVRSQQSLNKLKQKATQKCSRNKVNVLEECRPQSSPELLTGLENFCSLTILRKLARP